MDAYAATTRERCFCKLEEYMANGHSRRRLAAVAFGFSIAIFGASSEAGYDANMTGVVTEVLTYPNGEILFRLANQPSSHPSCMTDYFAIDNTANAAGVSRMYARLLSAHALGEAVNIGYDSQGDCTSGRIRVWRVG
jgi:hypothetical protein